MSCILLSGSAHVMSVIMLLMGCAFVYITLFLKSSAYYNQFFIIEEFIAGFLIVFNLDKVLILSNQQIFKLLNMLNTKLMYILRYVIIIMIIAGCVTIIKGLIDERKIIMNKHENNVSKHE
ncbi:hypothetical protein CLTEP_20280 [Clostridium tepidiprofundi DSM 19306]|uniref:Uncharacterized protein n=1 Tax=Clostridium tepidiprofundi DSM 19306 TaxID=1121338 RepID=A0A151B2Y9_9CLOT|nr:hypothetical protein [Clostridium tepidiprofundi]KYH34027.1 hypothetical protein CLTEP_20280 [Clostridium tepidiprofundi DSM 19306]